MDPISQARFDQLRKADPNTWSDDDRGFMRARRGYMPEEDARALGLDGDAPSEPVEEASTIPGGSTEPETSAPAPKKAKK